MSLARLPGKLTEQYTLNSTTLREELHTFFRVVSGRIRLGGALYTRKSLRATFAHARITGKSPPARLHRFRVRRVILGGNEIQNKLFNTKKKAVMTFQNIKLGRVFTAVAIIWGISIVLLFLTSCVTAPFMPAEMGERASEYLDTFSDPDTPMDESNEVFDDYLSEFSAEITVQYIIQWALVALLIFVVAGRVARRAESEEQAIGYGMMISIATVFSYGIMCACIPAFVLGTGEAVFIMVLFLGLFLAAGYMGGRQAAQNLQPQPGAPSGYSGPPQPGSRPGSRPGTAAGPEPGMVYNMGVQAALGGRREEARQHFTRVLQMQPRNVSAWLQLANLAETPEQAWNYVQQARAIDPNDARVQEAVNIIWPQVAADAEKYEPPRAQPPYPGASQGSSTIPSMQLPDDLDAPPDTDSPDDESRDEPDDSPDSSDSDVPPPPPPPPSQNSGV